MLSMLTLSVADLGFPQGGGTNFPGGRQHTISPKFPKNCMKLKEFGPLGGTRPKFYYVDLPLTINTKHIYTFLPITFLIFNQFSILKKFWQAETEGFSTMPSNAVCVDAVDTRHKYF